MIARAWCVAALLACVANQPGARPLADRAVPAAAGVPSGSGQVRFTSVTTGSEFTCALTAEGTAYCWGSNEDGQVGDGSRGGARLTPVPVAGRHTFRELSAGREHTCALTAEGQAFCWGYSPGGGEGVGSGALGVRDEWSRVPVPVATDLRFARISAGDQRTCAVTKEGAAYCWGRFSRPSDDPVGSGGPEVVRVETPVRFRSVEAGLTHACGITDDAQLYCWGSNRVGQLGFRLEVSSPRWVPPQPVSLGDAVTALSASTVGACAVTAAGAAYCWGRNVFGELGNGAWTERYAPNPTPARVLGDQRWKSSSTAGGFACGLTAGGEAFCWGVNQPPTRVLGTTAAPDRCDTLTRYAHGHGVECSTRPVPVVGNLRFRQLATGGHTCALSTDGVAYCWGPNESGQLGNGTTASSVEPVPVVAPVGDPPP